MVFEFQVSFLLCTMKMSEIRIDELPIVLQGKQSHWYISWEPVRTELTTIDSNDNVILVEIPIPYFITLGQLQDLLYVT